MPIEFEYHQDNKILTLEVIPIGQWLMQVVSLPYKSCSDFPWILLLLSYFPIQKLAKIFPNSSSGKNLPVISSSACCAKRNSSASNSPA